MWRDSVDSVWRRIAAVLLPPRCVLCRGSGQPPDHDLCAECEGGLPTADPASVRMDDGLSGPALDAPYRYDFPVDLLVQALKYDGALANARVLGRLLAQHLRSQPHAVDLIVPLPLHVDRLRERGFNQSYEIARIVSKDLAIPVDPRALARVRNTAAQVGLPRAARAANVRGAFQAAVNRVAGRRIALLDDVVTTGSTTRVAAEALRAAGAASVVVWAVAHTDV
jgi:ComF family protein